MAEIKVEDRSLGYDVQINDENGILKTVHHVPPKPKVYNYPTGELFHPSQVGPGKIFAETKAENMRFKQGTALAYLEHERKYNNYVDDGGNRTFISFCDPPALAGLAKLTGIPDVATCALTNHEIVTKMREGLTNYYREKGAKDIANKAKKLAKEAAAENKADNKKRKVEDI